MSQAHFRSVNEFKQFVENGFQEVNARIPTTKKRTHRSTNNTDVSESFSTKEINIMKTTAQTKKEIQLINKVKRDNKLAARVVHDTKIAQSILQATAATAATSPTLSAEMRRRRIVQVREQEKLWAASTNRRRRDIKTQLRSNMDVDAKENWERKQAERKKELKQRYTEALASIGAAQKNAVSLQRGLRTSAKEQMGAWQSTNEQHNALHRQAMKEQRSTITSYQQKVFDSEIRDRTRVDESDLQREEAHRNAAILQAAEAANRYVDQQRVELDYSRMGMDRRVETAVYDHGGGATDFSTTRIHHRVVRHQRPRTSPNTLSNSSHGGNGGNGGYDGYEDNGGGSSSRGYGGSNNQYIVSSRTTRQIPFVKSTGGRPRDGPAAVAARRAEHLHEAEEKIRKRRLQDERAHQRYRTASGKLHMKREYEAITSQLEKMEYDKRQQRAKEITSRNRDVVMDGGSGGNGGNGGNGGGNDSRDIEDQFERMFVDDRLTSVDLSGVVHVDDSQDVHLEDLQFIRGIDVTSHPPTETVYVRDMSEERREQEARMNAVRNDAKKTQEEARRRRMQTSHNSSSVSSIASISTTSASRVVLPRATALGMSSFTEGLPMEGEELEEYALRSNARRQQEEYDLQREDDLNGARASKVKISRNGSIEIILQTKQEQKETLQETKQETKQVHVKKKKERRFTQILSDIQLVGRDDAGGSGAEQDDENEGSNEGNNTDNDIHKDVVIVKNTEEDLNDLLEISRGLSQMAEEMTTHPTSPTRTNTKKLNGSVGSGEKYAAVSAVTAHHAERRARRDSLSMIANEAAEIAKKKAFIPNDGNGSDGDQETKYDAILLPTMSDLGLLPGDLDPTPTTLEELMVTREEEQGEKNNNDNNETKTFLDTDSLEGTPEKDMLGRKHATPSYLTEKHINESPMGTRDMDGGWTSVVYTNEQQERLGVDEMGETQVSQQLATTEEKSTPAAPVPVVARALPPAWVTNGLEPPAGEVDMGGWTSAVYTIEQQERLNVNELGVPRDDVITQRRKVEAKKVIKIAAATATTASTATTATTATIEVPTNSTLEVKETLVMPVKENNATSKKLSALRARSKARQAQLTKRKAERKIQKEKNFIKMKKEAANAASPYASTKTNKVIVTKSSNKTNNKRNVSKKKPTSYMTSPSLVQVPERVRGGRKEVTKKLGKKKKKGKIKQKTFEELNKDRIHAAHERRAKMKALDKQRRKDLKK